MGQEAISPPGPTPHAYRLPWPLCPVYLLACPGVSFLAWLKLHSKFSVGLCFDTGSLCVAAQAGLEQFLIALPLLPECFSKPSLMLKFVFANFLPRNSSELIRASALMAVLSSSLFFL